jgi:2-dehydro-3-deoxyglucarate aldolase/4-hydroxy-2-oxoheptanedioate aldolase
MTSLLERVRSLAPTRGTFLNLGSVLAAEVCALSGFDWLLVDLEHGAGGEEALVGQILAGAVHDVPVLVRTESAERIRAGHERPEEVVEALAHLWYPPSGDRGIAGYNRGRQFGGDGRDPSQVNASVLSVVQIETLQALINVEEIAAIPGVDVLFVGPNDLSASLGIPGQFESSDYLDALHRVSEACRNNHVAAGILATSGEQVEGLNERGYSFVGISSDSSLLRTAARAATRRDEPL